MKIAAISDMHGNLPAKVVPPCDLLIIAGDICPARKGPSAFLSAEESAPLQSAWLESKFRPWLEKQPAEKIVGVFGNHDWIGEYFPRLIPKKLKWTYLQDSFAEILGFKIYGTPWTPPFMNWAFNASEEAQEVFFSRIPEDIDILISHGPPYGILDQIAGEEEHLGSEILLKHVRRVDPSLFICGHIHSAHGIAQLDPGDATGGWAANVSLLDEHYQAIYKPVSFMYNDGLFIPD